jgi:hypothetical protein
MVRNATAMVAWCLRCSLISVIPTGCGIYKRTRPRRLLSGELTEERD